MAKLKAEEEVKPVGMTPEEIAEKERKAKAARAKKLVSLRCSFQTLWSMAHCECVHYKTSIAGQEKRKGCSGG